MLQRLLENRWAVSAVLSDPLTTKPSAAMAVELTNVQWHIINVICPVLDPIKLATVMLSAEENVSISIALPTVAGLLDNTVVNDEDPDTVRAFKEEFHQQLTTRFKLDVRTREDVTVLHKATYLDPRFSHMGFVTAGTKAVVIDVLRQELRSTLLASTAALADGESAATTTGSPQVPSLTARCKYCCCFTVCSPAERSDIVLHD